jgi:molybdopterin-synthase adenylyltransferase
MSLAHIERDLSKEELEYYSRQIVLSDIGYKGQLRLQNAKVCIVGLGGLGTPAAMQLVAMGVGFVRLVDRDIVEISNLHRQPLYDRDWIGYPKVEAANTRIKKINPHTKTELLTLSINEENAEKVIGDVDIVLDGLDHIEPRYTLNRACVRQRIPYIFAGAIENFGNLTTILPHKTPCLECFMPGLTDENMATCSVVGVHPSVLGVISSLQVSEAVKVILGHEPSLANKFLFCDLRKLTFDEITISRRTNCPICGDQEITKPAKTRKLVENICGRGGRPAFIIAPKENLNINMGELRYVLKKKKFQVKMQTRLSTKFNINRQITFSILLSGVTIVEGTTEVQKALNIFKEIIIDDLGINQSRIE